MLHLSVRPPKTPPGVLLALGLIVVGCASRSPRPAPPDLSALRGDAAATAHDDATIDAVPTSTANTRCFDEALARAAITCPTGGPTTAPTLTRIESILQPTGRSSSRPTRDEDRDRFHPRPFSATERQIVDERTAWICFAEHHPQAPEALLREQYNRALVYSLARHFDVAAPLLRDVALGDPSVPDPEGLRLIAADLYLDALNILGTHEPWSRSPACGVMLGDDVERLRAHLCTASTRAQREDFCQRMTILGCQAELHRAGERFEAGEFARAGAAYLQLAQRRECTLHGTTPLDLLLYEAANAFDRAGLDDDARRARELLVRTVSPARSSLASEARERLQGLRDAGADR